MKHEKHIFRGLDKVYEIELTAPDRLTEQLKAELEDFDIEAFDVRRNSLKVNTDDYIGLFEARCFSEALIPIDMKVDLTAEAVSSCAKPFMLDLCGRRMRESRRIAIALK